jgi:hypothetical protein
MLQYFKQNIYKVTKYSLHYEIVAVRSILRACTRLSPWSGF